MLPVGSQPFLASIRAAPDDDLPRLVFADWLDENGDPDRAEFIRFQVESAKGTATAAQRAREGELWQANRQRWQVGGWDVQAVREIIPDFPKIIAEEMPYHRGFARDMSTLNIPGGLALDINMACNVYQDFTRPGVSPYQAILQATLFYMGSNAAGYDEEIHGPCELTAEKLEVLHQIGMDFSLPIIFRGDEQMGPRLHTISSFMPDDALLQQLAGYGVDITDVRRMIPVDAQGHLRPENYFLGALNNDPGVEVYGVRLADCKPNQLEKVR